MLIVTLEKRSFFPTSFLNEAPDNYLLILLKRDINKIMK